MHKWEASVGEVLDCCRELNNANDHYAMAVVKSDMIGGYLPRKLSHILLLFARRGDVIQCLVSGKRWYSHDLPQRGMEIPRVLILKGRHKELKKLQTLWKT